MTLYGRRRSAAKNRTAVHPGTQRERRSTLNIVIIGASGFVGSRILSESLRRGHQMTAIARNPDRFPAHPRLTPVKGDINDWEALVPLVARHDVVISAFNPGQDESGSGARSIVNLAKRSGVRRLLVVGGAGSLEIAPGRRLIDEPSFPSEWKQSALRTADFLDTLRGESDLD